MQWIQDLPYAHAVLTIGLMYATFYSLFSTWRGLARIVRLFRTDSGRRLHAGVVEQEYIMRRSAIGSDQGLNRYNIHNDTYRFFN